MEHDDEKMIITLTMADYPYKLSVNRKDEHLYRDAAKLVNEKVNLYRSRVPGGSVDNYLVMVAFDMAYRWVEVEERNDTVPYRQSLEELVREFEERFRDEQPGEAESAGEAFSCG